MAMIAPPFPASEAVGRLNAATSAKHAKEVLSGLHDVVMWSRPPAFPVLIETGACEAVLALLERFPSDADLAVEVCSALLSLNAGSMEARARLVEAGALEAVKGILERFPPNSPPVQAVRSPLVNFGNGNFPGIFTRPFESGLVALLLARLQVAPTHQDEKLIDGACRYGHLYMYLFVHRYR
jgi:hypothetical protein